MELEKYIYLLIFYDFSKKMPILSKQIRCYAKKVANFSISKVAQNCANCLFTKKNFLRHIILLKYPQFSFKPVAPFVTECCPLKVYSQKRLVKAVQTKISKSKRDASSCRVRNCQQKNNDKFLFLFHD